jgi:hypothetical protein
MIRSIRVFLILTLVLLGLSKIQAQGQSELEDIAYDHLNNSEFQKAYDAFDKLASRFPKEIDYRFKLGICALSNPDKKAKAIDIFKQINQESSTRESQFYLAKAYHINYKFDEAIGVLKPMIDALANSKKKDDVAFVNEANLVLSNCFNGKVMLNNAFSTASVKNIGFPINSKETEAVPIITADETMMIFTYVGRKSIGGKQNAALETDASGTYLADIYMSIRNPDSTWRTPTPIKSLNTRAQESAIAMSPDGMTLYTFFSSNENEGDIQVSKFNGADFGKPEPLNSNVNHPDYWEGSCSISADGKILYFVSERPNGFGGRDIWKSELIDDDWGPAVNLGPQINTKYDEDSPFIHPDGVTLYFSSKGHSSIGDYDVMFSTLDKGEWTEPRNMGLPLNTTEEDRYYVLNSKGDRGYFSSSRASTDSKGGQDIYLVLPGDMVEKLVVAMFKGVVYGDNKPMEAKIEVTRVQDNEVTGSFASNGLTGKYLLTLKPGFIYHVKVSAFGFDALEEDIDLETLTGYIERSKDYNLYSKPFIANNPWDVKPQTEKKYKPSEDEIAFFNQKPKSSPATGSLTVNTATAYVALNTASVATKVESKKVGVVAKKNEPKKDEPIAVKSEPKKDEPSVVKEEPKKDEPLVVKEEPKKDEPLAVKEEPKKDEPLAVKEETKKDEPLAVKEETKKEEPLAVKEETKKEEPLVVKEETKKEEPIVVKEEPKKDEPVAVKEEPKKDEPLAVKEEPKKDEPFAVKEDPKKVEPLAVKVEPKKVEPLAVKEEPKKVEPVAVKVEPKKVEPVAVKVEPKKVEPVAVKVETKKAEQPIVKEVLVKGDVIAMEPMNEPVVRNKKVEVEKPETFVKAEIKTGTPCNASIASLASIKGQSLNDPMVYRKMLNLVGEYCAENVVFKVQVGAYRKPDNYKGSNKYSKMKTIGAVDKAVYPDGITRFTLNEFNTINAAEKYRQKAIANGQKDSWIVVFANGTRYTLEDFIMADFLGKAIN